MVFQICRSNTDQCGRGATVSLHSLAGSLMCPVWFFQAYLAFRPCGPLLLLVHKDGSFLSRFQFVQVFQRCLWQSSFNATEFRFHSFGTATEAVGWGLSTDVVKKNRPLGV